MKRFFTVIIYIVFLFATQAMGREGTEYFIKVSCIPEIKYFGIEVIEGYYLHVPNPDIPDLLWDRYNVIAAFWGRDREYECKILDKPFKLKVFTGINSNGAVGSSIFLEHDSKILFKYLLLFDESQRETITEIEKVEFSDHYWRYTGSIYDQTKQENKTLTQRIFYNKRCGLATEKIFPITNDYFYEQLDKTEKQKFKEEKENSCIGFW